MAEYCPDLAASDVNERLKASLETLRLAEKNAVFWFAEVMQRRLYLELGYSSVQQYAELELGFKKARTSQFIRLSETLRELPKLRDSVARGEVSWTKAREVSGVATRKTESAWIAEARTSTSRELERKVAITKGRARAMRSGTVAQAEMLGPENVVRPYLKSLAEPSAKPAAGPANPSGELSTGSADESAPRAQGQPPAWVLAEEVPCDLHHRLSPTQFARYEALVEKLRKLGVPGSREELLLECLEIAVEVKAANRDRESRAATARETMGRRSTGRESTERKPAERKPTERKPTVRKSTERKSTERKSTSRAGDPEEWCGEDGSPGKSGQLDHSAFPRGNARATHQVTTWMCEGCGTGTVETSRGPMKLAPATMKAILCDARVRKRGERNRSVLPERIRRQVLERDRMRCRGAGCNRTRFLAVHHLVPRKAGGTHDPDNLVTLCEGCHQAAHRHPNPPPLRRTKGKHHANEVREPECKYTASDRVPERMPGRVPERMPERVPVRGQIRVRVRGRVRGRGRVPVRGPGLTVPRYPSAAVEQFLIERRVE